MSSVISKRFDDQQNQSGGSNTDSPVVGKVSIGVPTDEPVLVDQAEGLKTRFPIQVKGNQKISQGTVLSSRHIDLLKEEGKREVHVVRGKYPKRLDHFRLLRKSNINSGFVEDPALYDKYDLERGKTLTEIPIVLTSENIDRVLQTRLVNYDRENNCVFCQSDDGYKYERRKTDENGEYLSSGEMKTGECVPFYWDDRVKSGDKNICPFRETGGSGRDCDFRGSLYFQILSEEGDINIGRLFKLETTSSRTAQYYTEALMDPSDGVKAKFGRISFVPLKLEIVKETAIRPGGSRYEDRKKTEVYRTTLSTDTSLLGKYMDSIKEMKDKIEFYRQMSVPGTGADPTTIPTEEVDDGDEDRWQAEFRPEQQQEQLRKEGVLDDSVPDEAQLEGAEEPPEPAEKPAGEPADDKAYQIRRSKLIDSARRLPTERYTSFLGNRDKLSPETIDTFEKHLKTLLEPLSDEEMQENRVANLEMEEDMSDENRPDVTLP